MPQTWGWAGAVSALLLASAALRLPLLDRRPMHADEAILADKLGTLLSTGTYPYDPREYHGRVLACLAWIPAHLTGRTTYASLTELGTRRITIWRPSSERSHTFTRLRPTTQTSLLP